VPEFHRICCAVDFSGSSRLALEEAASLAARFGAELALVHVSRSSPRGGEAIYAPPPREPRALPKEAQELESWQREAERLSGRPAISALLSGRPAAAIAQYAGEGGFDLLVVGSHGRTGPRRLVLGSVAEEVVRTAHCPVLVARGRPGGPRPPATS
jgi:universal stress protein A